MSVDWPNLFPHIAHEVRAQARKGLSNAQFLERILGPAAVGEVLGHLRAIKESQTDLNILFSRLAILADAEAQPQLSSTRPEQKVTLETAVLGAKIECRDALRREGAEFVAQSLPVCEVPPKIQVVLRELIDNSVRFRDPERPLRIVMAGDADGARVRVQVSDNGSGIDLAYADRLFQPFQRLDPRRSGFGLGLAIAHGILAALNGKIYHEPTELGATFVFELPNR